MSKEVSRDKGQRSWSRGRKDGGREDQGRRESGKGRDVNSKLRDRSPGGHSRDADGDAREVEFLT